MLEQLPPEAIRIEAYHTDEIKTIEITQCNYPIPTSLAEFGCALSHLHALHAGLALPQKPEWWVVLEDDIVFDKPVDFARIVTHAEKEKVDWDLIQTFTNNPTVVASLWRTVYYETNKCFHPWKFEHYGTGSYIIRRKAAEKILQQYAVAFHDTRIQRVDFSTHNHKMVSDLILYQSTKTWTLTFPIHRTLDEDSHIHETHLDMHRHSNSTSLNIQQMVRSPFNSENQCVLGIALNSGLGNRLFQLAAAYGIAKKLGRECLIATICEDQAHGIKANHFQYITNRFHAHTLFKPIELQAMALVPRIPETPQGKTNRMRVICETKKFARDESAILSVAASSREVFPVLFGFWQLEDYFLPYREEIRELFREPEYIEIFIKRTYPDLDFAQFYFIHVRLGDFCNAANRPFHYVDLSDYYSNAMQEIRTKDPEARFLVFCEEPTKIAQVYPVLKDIPVHQEPRDLVNFYAMTRCKGGICANSTYSWWAAWLLPAGSLVCIPKRWFPESNQALHHVTLAMQGAFVIG